MNVAGPQMGSAFPDHLHLIDLCYRVEGSDMVSTKAVVVVAWGMTGAGVLIDDMMVAVLLGSGKSYPALLTF